MSAQRIWILSLAYFTLLVALAGRLSLWLDEVLQLIGVRGLSLPQILRYLSRERGSTPLGYLVQAIFVNGLGYSVLTARVSSVLASVLTCVTVWAIARKLNASGAIWAACVLMILPFQFRYALEARPYAMALMFTALSTLLFLQLLGRFSLTKVVVYGVVIAAGLYTQPLSLFVPLSHVLWIACSSSTVDSKRVRNAIALAIAAACILFAPWFFYVRIAWKTPAVLDGPGFHLNVSIPLMLLREISGAGYLGSALLLSAACVGSLSPAFSRPMRRLLWLTILGPVLGALMMDASFDYFLAIRQMIFALPSLVVLAGEGFLYTYQRNQRLGGLFVTVFLAVALWYDVGWFRHPREDWQAAAAALSAATKTACMVAVPSESLRLYAFFEPDLSNHLCLCAVTMSPSAVVALAPIRPDKDGTAAITWLTALGYHRGDGDQTVGRTQLLRFERHPQN